MRLTQAKKNEIKNTIIDSLYKKTEQEFREKKRAIVLKDYNIKMEPWLELVSKVPVIMLFAYAKYEVKISYKKDIPEEAVETVWQYTFEKPRVLPPHDGARQIASSYYHNNYIKYPLDPSLYQETSVLLEELIKFQKEQYQMNTFLNTTLDNTSTVNQLKKVWPEPLHKFLPHVPVQPRKPRQKKQEVPVIEVPDALNTRLITNIIEGN